MKIWVNKAKGFKKARQFDINYYVMTPEQRLDTVQLLREMNLKISGRKQDKADLELLSKKNIYLK